MEFGCMKLKNTERWRKTSIKAGDVRDNPYDPLRITISERTEQNRTSRTFNTFMGKLSVVIYVSVISQIYKLTIIYFVERS